MELPAPSDCSPWSPLIRAAVRMSSRNQSSCSQLWFCRSRSWGGRHGQADQRVAAADLHGDVRRERHIRRNPAPLSEGRTWSAPELRFSQSRSRFWPSVHFGGERKSKRRAMVPPLVVSGRTAAPGAAAQALGGVFVGALSHRALVTSCELRTHHKSFRDRGTANSSENVENGSGGTDAHPQE